MTLRPFYARAGEQVICENGHPFGRFTCDVRAGDQLRAHMLTELPPGVVLRNSNPAAGVAGSRIPACPTCAGRVVVGSYFIFADGHRLVAGGVVKSFPLPLRQHFPWAEEFGLVPGARAKA